MRDCTPPPPPRRILDKFLLILLTGFFFATSTAYSQISLEENITEILGLPQTVMSAEEVKTENIKVTVNEITLRYQVDYAVIIAEAVDGSGEQGVVVTITAVEGSGYTGMATRFIPITTGGGEGGEGSGTGDIDIAEEGVAQVDGLPQTVRSIEEIKAENIKVTVNGITLTHLADYTISAEDGAASGIQSVIVKVIAVQGSGYTGMVIRLVPFASGGGEGGGDEGEGDINIVNAQVDGLPDSVTTIDEVKIENMKITVNGIALGNQIHYVATAMEAMSADGRLGVRVNINTIQGSGYTGMLTRFVPFASGGSGEGEGGDNGGTIYVTSIEASFPQTISKGSSIIINNLKPTVLPQNATNQQIIWSVQSATVATYNPDNGEIIFISEGIANIFATIANGSENGDFTRQWRVQVLPQGGGETGGSDISFEENITEVTSLPNSVAIIEEIDLGVVKVNVNGTTLTYQVHYTISTELGANSTGEVVIVKIIAVQGSGYTGTITIYVPITSGGGNGEGEGDGERDINFAEITGLPQTTMGIGEIQAMVNAGKINVIVNGITLRYQADYTVRTVEAVNGSGEQGVMVTITAVQGSGYSGMATRFIPITTGGNEGGEGGDNGGTGGSDISFEENITEVTSLPNSVASIEEIDLGVVKVNVNGTTLTYQTHYTISAELGAISTGEVVIVKIIAVQGSGYTGTITKYVPITGGGDNGGTIYVTSIEASFPQTITKGGLITIANAKATVFPENATNKQISWSVQGASYNPNNGEIIFPNEGYATIIAIIPNGTQSGNYEYRWQVQVLPQGAGTDDINIASAQVTGLPASVASIEEVKAENLIVTVAGVGVLTYQVHYSVRLSEGSNSNGPVVKVDITAISGSGYTGTITKYVPITGGGDNGGTIYVTSIEASFPQTISKGSSIIINNLKPTVLPQNATNQQITWSVQSATVATYNPDNGEIIFISEGIANIFATIANGSENGNFIQQWRVQVLPQGAGTDDINIASAQVTGLPASAASIGEIKGEDLILTLDSRTLSYQTHYTVITELGTSEAGEQGIIVKIIAVQGSGYTGMITRFVTLTVNAPQYSIVINGGTLSPNQNKFVRGAMVKAIANSAPTGKLFDKWLISMGNASGGTSQSVQLNGVNATDQVIEFAMPSFGIALNATYKDAPEAVAYYSVIVDGRALANSFKAGANVSIMVSQAPEGQEFEKWKITSQGKIVSINGADLTKPTLTFAMPKMNLEITGSFKAIAQAPKYAVTLSGGTGGGSYEENSQVSLAATIPSGYVFGYWDIQPAGILSVDAKEQSVSFKMPKSDLAIKAVFSKIAESSDANKVVQVASILENTEISDWISAAEGDSKIEAQKTDEGIKITAQVGENGFAAIESGISPNAEKADSIVVKYASGEVWRLYLDIPGLPIKDGFFVILPATKLSPFAAQLLAELPDEASKSFSLADFKNEAGESLPAAQAAKVAGMSFAPTGEGDASIDISGLDVYLSDEKPTPIFALPSANLNFAIKAANGRIFFENLPANAKVAVYDIKGNTVSHTKVLNAGIYIVKVKAAGLNASKIITVK